MKGTDRTHIPSEHLTNDFNSSSEREETLRPISPSVMYQNPTYGFRTDTEWDCGCSGRPGKQQEGTFP